jgi:trehalose 6-phosphate synthase
MARRGAAGGRPVIVCNRAPYEPTREGASRRGAGGVVTALISLAEVLNADWVACARTPTERTLANREERGFKVGANERRVHYASPTADAYRLHYSVIANPLLWFTQHYLWDLAREPRITTETHRAWDQGYVRVNQEMAATAVHVAAGNGSKPLVLSHDYQLYLVPQLVREALPKATIQHFVHIPWPTPQYWKVLPVRMRDAIMRGLLAADVVGFQSHLDVRNFLLGCEENLGLRVDWDRERVSTGGRETWVRAYPISIDIDRVEQMARWSAVGTEVNRFIGSRPEKLIVRVDRCDPSKNVLRGFIAFAKLLGDHPELQRRVQFLAFLQPSREEVSWYRIYLNEVRQLVDHINAEYGDSRWRPIRLELGEGIRRAMALYREFDVLLVNSTFDGMNLVAKEAIIANQRDGVLVLSENAGAHAELAPASVSVNPFDIEATARALHRALVMPVNERRGLLERGRAIISNNTVHHWIERQRNDLASLAAEHRAAS